MELKLEHLAIAMVNNMLLQYFDDERELLHNDCKIVELREEEMTIANSEYQYDVKFYDVNIIARPLSDLTKEIEVNGEKFVPIMVLFGGEDYRQYDFTIDTVEKPILGKRIEISIKDIGSPCITFGVKNPLNNSLNYQNWQLLLSWHFDLFNLIPNGLAIDVNTLKEPKQTPQ